jgi:hypothetical protein
MEKELAFAQSALRAADKVSEDHSPKLMNMNLQL